MLGSIFFHNDALDEITEILRPEHFYLDSHRKIFEAILRLRDSNRRAFDAVTVGEEVERLHPISDIDGYDYLREIVECVPHAAHAVHYAETVREKAMRRMAIYACSDGVAIARNEMQPIEEAIGQIDAELLSIVEHKSRNAQTDIRTILLDAMAVIGQGRKRGVLTGYDDLDKLTNGFQPGTMSILAARPSVGKTAFVVALILQVAERGTPVLFFSMEQTRLEIALRTLGIRCGISVHNLNSGHLQEYERDAIARESSMTAEFPIFIDDTAGLSVTDLAARARVHKRKHGTGFIVLDYIQLLRAHDQRIPREQQVSFISQSIKSLAKSLDVPILALAQLNRQIESSESKRPKLSYLRESGSLEQDADLVMFLDRPHVYDNSAPEGLARIFIEKQRNGPKGEVGLSWSGETMHFRPGTQVHYDEGASYYRPEQDEQEQREKPRSFRANRREMF